MQSAYAERFSREMGCTPEEWLRWLPAAIGDHPWQLDATAAKVGLGEGALTIRWRQGEPRVIALVRMPRLHVDFEFHQVDEANRFTFMKRFDLYMQRGGG